MPSRYMLSFCALLCLALPALQAQDHAHRQNLGRAVNTRYIEIMPLVSPDGNTLYFDCKNDSLNTGGTDDDDDIYVSTLRSDGSWSAARNIGPPLNTAGSDLMCWISQDGNTALVHNGDLAKHDSIGLGITHRTDGRWSVPTPIVISGLSSLGDGYYATISPDGRRLLIAYPPDPNNDVNTDFYVCASLSPDMISWGPPVTMGPDINSQRFEGAPFIASDNRTLYFTSNRYGGLGSTDLYMTRRLDETWMHWSTPVNLGITVNTTGAEASLTISARGDYAYVSGEAADGEDNYGKTDIYRINLPDSLSPIPMVIVQGRLTDRTDAPLQGLIRAESAVTGVEIATSVSSPTGTFLLRLPCDERYRLSAVSVGYDETAVEFDGHNHCGVAWPLQLRLHPEDTSGTGIHPARQTALFAFGSDELTRDAVAILTKSLPWLKLQSKSLTLEVTGHTDAIGEQSQNQTLSLRRAERVKSWLVAHGIPATGIMAFGRGVLHPAATNDTPEGRSRNRRVEIRVVDRGEK